MNSTPHNKTAIVSARIPSVEGPDASALLFLDLQ
jgi:hypothetical protein